MSQILRILAIALITVLANMIVKQSRPEIAMIITLVGSILIIFMTVSSLNSVISSFYNIFKATKVDSSLLTPLFKIIALGYITEFGANICVDAGIGGLADKILFSGKVLILLVALPIITTVVDLVMGLL